MTDPRPGDPHAVHPHAGDPPPVDPTPVDHTLPGRLLARGREATIHELGPDRVLRRYDDGRDVTAEVAVMRHVARHGFRVPVVHGLHVDADGRPTGMVLERVDGPSLVEVALSGRLAPADVGRTLARLHGDLHRVPVTGFPVPPGAHPASRGDVVVHLDLHPANVLVVADVPVVIDWAMARPGPASLDTAMTALTLAAAVVAGVPADAGDVARLPVPPGLVEAVLEAYLVALPVPPTPSLDRAVAVLDLVGAQPPDVVRAALAVVRRVLGEPGGPGPR
jgi:tRNA A-37 threonylcarbamoyl transferase component Bud32